MSFTCTDKDTLVAYVYDECDDATRGAVNAHLATCTACADEVRGFASVRKTLSRWAPPDRVTGFRLVRDDVADAPASATVLRPSRWWQKPLPAMMRVAAAILLFAGGAALANLEVRYDKDGFVVRTGWNSPAPAAVRAGASQTASADQQMAPVSSPTPVVTPAEGQANSPWRVDMAALERNLREEFHQQLVAARASGGEAGPVKVSTDADAGEARLMTQVHALIDESYRRQQVEMAYRLSQVEREFHSQRNAEVVRTQGAFGQLDGPPIYAPEQRQMMNYIRLNPVSLKK